MLSDAEGGLRGEYREPNPELTFEKFTASLVARAIGLAKSRE
jgi:hypothetical protein